MISSPERFRVAMLMAFIGAIAAGLGGMRLGSPMASHAAIGVAEVAMLTGLLGSITRRGEASWVGFVLFGSAYFVPAFLLPVESDYDRRLNPGTPFVEWLVFSLHPGPGPARAVPAFNAQFIQAYAGGHPIEPDQLVGAATFPQILSLLSADERDQFNDYMIYDKARKDDITSTVKKRANARDIGHASFALIFALIGATFGRLLRRSRQMTATLSSVDDSQDAGPSPSPGDDHVFGP